MGWGFTRARTRVRQPAARRLPMSPAVDRATADAQRECTPRASAASRAWPGRRPSAPRPARRSAHGFMTSGPMASSGTFWFCSDSQHCRAISRACTLPAPATPQPHGRRDTRSARNPCPDCRTSRTTARTLRSVAAPRAACAIPLRAVRRPVLSTMARPTPRWRTPPDTPARPLAAGAWSGIRDRRCRTGPCSAGNRQRNHALPPGVQPPSD